MTSEPKLIAHITPNPPRINAEQFTLDDFVGVGDTVKTTLSDGPSVAKKGRVLQTPAPGRAQNDPPERRRYIAVDSIVASITRVKVRSPKGELFRLPNRSTVGSPDGVFDPVQSDEVFL